MGVTQYIGARYVPLFAEPAEWNNTRTYEPLTIVIHEGNSYTAKQYVPKGIDIANEKFWALTGNYNAQVEQYRKDVITYRKYVDTSVDKMENDLSTAVDKMENDLSTAVDKMENDLSTAVDKMENDLSRVDSKITDSVQPAIDSIELNYNKCYDTVAAMQSDTKLQNGMIVKTLGFYSIGDFGDAFYKINNNLTANSMDVIKCQNSLQAQLIIETELCINALGAKGDGSNDSDTRTTNMNAFARAFELNNNIECQPNGTYFFPIDKAVNCRTVTNDFTFNGNYSNLADFTVEFSLASDSYDWGKTFNWHTGVIRNVNFGINYSNADNKAMTPCIITGMGVAIENVIMYNKNVLLAYVDRYIDHMKITNVSRTGEHYNDDTIINYNLIMCINKDGSLKKEMSNGDDWSFNQIREIYSEYSDANNGKYYGLITTRNNASISFNDCIQILVDVGLYTQAQFNSCHFENNNTGVILDKTNTLVLITFTDCYFYQSTMIPISNRCTYIGCLFKSMGKDKKTIGKSIMSNCKIIKCMLERTYRIITSTEIPKKIGANYVGSPLSYFDTRLTSYSDTFSGWTGETEVTCFVRFVESPVYKVMLNKTFNPTEATSYKFTINNCSDAILDLYIKNNGKIYHSQTRVYGNFASVEMYTNIAETYTNIKKYRELETAYCYPNGDTTEIVDSIPNYTERATAYQIAPNVVVDTANNTHIPGCTMIDKSILSIE